MKRILNAKTLPKVYYGLHMAEGVAEYLEDDGTPYRILINENTIKSMDPTFGGKPLYVEHVAEVDLPNLQTEADGYVIESFFNKLDGKHWAKFIVVSDAGHEAIRKGWTLSNAYLPKSFKNEGGLWHGVEYKKEVMNGEYEHLAIVENPRYEESVIMTPEEFKTYCEEKESQLQKIANSKEKTKMKFNMFKKTKVENSIDLDGMMIELPKSKIEMSLAQVVNELDVIKNMQGYANGDHMVKMDNEEMSVNDLMAKHKELKDELESMKKNAEGDDEEKKENEDDAVENEDEEKKENEDDAVENEDEEKKENEDDEEEKKEKPVEKKENSKSVKKDSYVKKLKNAHRESLEEAPRITLVEDQVARGKARYGSN